MSEPHKATVTDRRLERWQWAIAFVIWLLGLWPISWVWYSHLPEPLGFAFTLFVYFYAFALMPIHEVVAVIWERCAQKPPPGGGQAHHESLPLAAETINGPDQTTARNSILAASRRRLKALQRLAADNSLNPKDLAVAKRLAARQQAIVTYGETLSRTELRKQYEATAMDRATSLARQRGIWAD